MQEKIEIISKDSRQYIDILEGHKRTTLEHYTLVQLEATKYQAQMVGHIVTAIEQGSVLASPSLGMFTLQCCHISKF